MLSVEAVELSAEGCRWRLWRLSLAAVGGGLSVAAVGGGCRWRAVGGGCRWRLSVAAVGGGCRRSRPEAVQEAAKGREPSISCDAAARMEG
jgi:hypothetical protein